MAENTPNQSKENKFPVVPLIVIIAVLGIAFLSFRKSIFTSFYEKRAEQMFEKETGGKADINFDGESNFEFETEEGKVVINQDGELPEDFPEDLAIYTEAEVMAYISMDSEDVNGFNTTISTGDSQEDVYNFYLAQLEKDGWEILSKLSSDTYSSVSATKETRTLVVTITADENTTIAVLTQKTD